MKKHPVIFYGWIIVATSLIVKALAYSARYSFSVIFPSLLEEFHWPRDATAGMLSVHLLFYGLVSPVAGGLVDRIGPRKTMAFGTMLLSLGMFLSRWGSEPWHFYLSFGVLSGAGLCLMGSVPITAVLRNWFERKRGLAFSLVHCGVGGSFATYPAIAFLINRTGWRNTFVVEALIITAVVLPLIAFVMRYHPREKGLVRDGVVEAGDPSPASVNETLRITNGAWAAVDWTLSKAARTSRFWLLCLMTFSVWGIAQHIMVAHHVAFAIDAGYSKLYASSVISLFGIMFALGSLAAIISDRIGREPTFTIGAAIGIAGILVLMLIKDTSHPWMLYCYAISLGFGLGMISPTITASLTDIFQGPMVGSVIGFVWFSFAMGGTIGPWLGGWIFEFTGNYMPAFILSAALLAVACAAIWLAAPRNVRLVPGRVKNRQNR
ncbi:MAG: MFS transporter [Deltaproteobacteria bacterium]|nr:MFS transporter [Deltaproteobacteria bacterium]MBW2306097.1 MFS transporter [Deltaproteobacteria bacterium]